MDYELKYNESRVKMEEMVANGLISQEAAENIFPELKESEDEKMLREIKQYIKEQGDKPTGLPNGAIAVADMLAWLEHHKPAKWNRDDEQYLQVTKNALAKYQVSDQWDANIISRWLENKVKSNILQPNQEWNEDDNITIGYLCTFIKENGDDYYGKNKPNVISWLKTLKNRIVLQPQQEWSDDDERLRKSCIAHIEDELERIRNDKYGHSEIISDLKESCRERINWLESLRSRNHWKPSEEQMKALDDAIKNPHLSTAEYNGLIALKEQLKKL